MELFRVRCEVFRFFIKYWMPYERKCINGDALWQKRSIDQLGIELENLRTEPNFVWRRDFTFDQVP